MAAIAESSSSANQSSPRRRITVRSAASHHLDTCPNPGNLRIQFQIYKSYSTDESQGFRRKTFSGALWFPLSVLADRVKILPDFWKMFTKAKLADEENLWGEIVDLVLTSANNVHVPNTRQLLAVGVRIEVPASETDINELRQLKDSDEGSLVIDDECSICFEELDSGEDLTETVRCLHVFHSSCLRKWLKAKDSCPLCRRVLIS